MTPDALASLPAIVAARALLDDALVAARAIALEEVPAGPVVDALAEALRLAYVALASLGDANAFAEARQGAADRTRDALERLQVPAAPDATVDEVVQIAARALRLLLGASLPVLDPAPLLPHATDVRPAVRATLDEPRLLDLTRDVLRPAVPVAERPPSDAPSSVSPPDEPAPAVDPAALHEQTLASLRAVDRDDDDDEPRAPAALPPAPVDLTGVDAACFGERLTMMDVIFERARGCLEDLGAFGLARRPMEVETWWCPRTEARLLARIDALAACGEAVMPWLVRLLEERPVPDPELTWAVLLFFGCIAGDDAADQALRVARLTPLDDPEIRAAVADAFTHAPHPGLPARLRPWLEDPDPGRREVALVALGRRALLPPDALAAYARDPDPSVARAAVEGFLMVPMERDAVADALAHPDESVLRAALDAAVRCAPALGVERAAELMRAGEAERGDAAMHLAVGAGSEGLAVLHGDGAITPTRCEALGWYGHAASVGVLLQALTIDHAPTVASAAFALWRITGAPLTKDDPSPELDPPPFGREPWGDDELPGCPVELSVDPAVWAAWWEAHGAGADPSLRWRYGRPWRVDDNVRVLAAKTSVPRDRRWASLELVARTGRGLPFDAWRFIPRQLEQIAAWREATTSRPTTAPWAVAGSAR